MISQELEQALNNQINLEFSSGYAYLAMAAWFEAGNLPGFSNWYRLQAQEEAGHAMRLFKFVLGCGGTITLDAVDAPQAKWERPEAAVKAALSHEQNVTASIHKLYELAQSMNDYATQTHLHWFIEEQWEEEKSAEDLLGRLDLIGDDMGALLILDSELATRLPTPAPISSEAGG